MYMYLVTLDVIFSIFYLYKCTWYSVGVTLNNFCLYLVPSLCVTLLFYDSLFLSDTLVPVCTLTCTFIRLPTPYILLPLHAMDINILCPTTMWVPYVLFTTEEN